MEKFDPVDIEFLINNAKVKTDAKKVKDEITGIGDTAEKTASKMTGKGGSGNVSKPLHDAGNAAEISGNKAAAARPKWNGLGNSINQITRELPAFTYSAQTGFLALSNNIPILADEISRLKAQNDALTKSGQKAVPVWKQVLSGLFSWNTLLSLGVVALTVYGDQIMEFVKELFQGKKAIDELKRSKETLNKAFEGDEFQKAVKEVNELRIALDLAKDGMADKNGVVKMYNETIGETSGKVKTLNEVEKGLIDNADAYIEMTLKKAAANLALEEASKKALEAAQVQQKDAEEFTSLYEKDQAGLNSRRENDPYGIPQYDDEAYEQEVKAAGEKRKQERIKKAEEEGDALLEIANKFMKEAADAAKKMNGILFGDASKESDKKAKKIVDDRQKLLEKIADLDREFARKRLDRDEEELQALRDKFDKVRRLIEEFNKDPKNKARRIDVSGLDAIQSNAESDLIYRQETRSLEKELQEQKKLYEEIEQYKKDFGITRTRERYAEQLKEFENFASLLKGKIAENKEAFTAVDEGTDNGGQIERVRLLREAMREEKEEARANYQELLKEYQDYYQKRRLLLERFQEDYQQLREKGHYKEAAERKEVLQQELSDLDEANYKKKEAYKALFIDLADITRREALKIAANAKLLLDSLDPSTEAYRKLEGLIKEFEEDLSQLDARNIYELSNAIGGFSQQLLFLGDSLESSGLKEIGSFLGGLSQGLNTLSKALDAQETESQLDDYMVALEGVMQLVNMVASAAQRRKKAEEDYYNSVLGLQLSYNLALNEQLRLQSEIGENAWLKDYEGRLTAGNEALDNAMEGYQASLDKLEEGRVKTGQRNAIDWGNVGSGAASGAALGATIGSVVPVIGNVVGGIVGAVAGGLAGLFGGKKKKDQWGDLLREYPGLIERSEDGMVKFNSQLAESLIQYDLLDEKTEKLVQNTLDWEKAMEDARAQIREVIVDLTGGFGNDLRNALVDAFRDGEDSAIAMGKTVEKVLENIISNMLFNRIFSQAFDKLEDEMASSYDVGGDQNWVDDFTRFFNQAEGLTDDFNQAMQDAQQQAGRFGFDIFQPTEDQQQANGLQAAIRRELTEETGSELTGLFRGQFDITKRNFQLNERRYDLEERHYNISIAILQNSALIEQNTAATVIQLQYAVAELRTLNNNRSQTARDLGRG